MLPEYLIRYDFDQSTGGISTDEEQIIIGFSTQVKKGLLMFITDNNTKTEYISVEVNNNGMKLTNRDIKSFILFTLNFVFEFI